MTRRRMDANRDGANALSGKGCGRSLGSVDDGRVKRVPLVMLFSRRKMLSSGSPLLLREGCCRSAFDVEAGQCTLLSSWGWSLF